MDLRDGDINAKRPIYGTPVTEVDTLWTERAKARYAKSGGDFWLACGGQLVTTARKDVCESEEQVSDLLHLTAELARAR